MIHTVKGFGIGNKAEIDVFLELSCCFDNPTAATAKSLQSCPTLSTPWTAACQAPPSMGFSRQEYWSGLPLPSPTNIFWIIKKAREFQKNIYFCFIAYAKAFDCVDHNNCGKF